MTGGIDLFSDATLQVKLDTKLDKAADLSDVSDAAEARKNIGVGGPVIGAINNLPVTPNFPSYADGSSGLWVGTDPSGNPMAAIILDGVPQMVFLKPAALSDTDQNNFRVGTMPGFLESLSAPAFQIISQASGRTKISSNGAVWIEGGDVIDLGGRFANADGPNFNLNLYPYDEEVSGAEILSLYGQAMRSAAYTPGTAGYGYGSEHNSVLPIILSGVKPTFVGTFPSIQSGITGYINNRQYIIRLPYNVQSGNTPTVNLNGWGAKKLLRHSGAAPANDYWNTGAEIVAIYSAAADGGNGAFLPEDTYGSDLPTGLTENLRPVYYFGRCAAAVIRQMGNPHSLSQPGQLEFRTTPVGNIREVPRAWISPNGMMVAAGGTAFEEGSDGNGYYMSEAKIKTLPQRAAFRNRKGYFDGLVDPTVVEGWANMSIPSPDAPRGPGLSLRMANARDQGIDFSTSYSNNELQLIGVKAGVSTIAITAFEDNGSGLLRITLTSPHGLVAPVTIRIAGSQAGIGEYAADPTDPDGTGFYDGVWLATPITATKIDILAIYKPSFTPAGTISIAQREIWGRFKWQTGEWNFSKALIIKPNSSNVNFINIAGAAAGLPAIIDVTGSDAAINIQITPKGNGSFVELGTAIKATYSATHVNYIEIDGGVSGSVNSPAVKARGTDTHIKFRILAKGTNGYVATGTPLIQLRPAETSLSTASDQTLTAAHILNGTLIRDPNGASRSDTLPTAALLVAAIANAAVGDVIECLICNAADAAETITILAGAGGAFVTLIPAGAKVIPQNGQKLIRIRLTNVTAASEAYTVAM